MKTIIHDECEFKQYLDTEIYSNQKGDVISINFNRTNEIGYFKLSDIGNGYLRITTFLNKKITSILAHRVIAICWIPNPENKKQVNHINGIKYDNRVCNLEWNTSKENIHHSIKTGLRPQKYGSENQLYGKFGKESIRAKKVLNTATGKIYDCLKDAQKDSVYSYKNLSRKLTGNRKNNTTFEYVA